MGLKREFYVSLAGAALSFVLLFALASTMVMVNIGDFRKQVEQLFRVDLSAAAPAVGEITQERGATLAGRTALGEQESLFVRAPQLPQLPPVSLETFADSGVDLIDFPAQPPLGLGLAQADLTAPGMDGLSGAVGAGGVEIIALRRETGAGVKVYNKEIGIGAQTLPRREPSGPQLPATNAKSLQGQSLPEASAAATARQPELSGGNFILPSEAGLKMRELVSFRPQKGYESLDDDMEARFYLEGRGGENYFRVEFFLREKSALPVLEKDVLFLIDVSQSIPAAQIKAVRETVSVYLKNLRPGDRWNVCIFSEQTLSFSRDYSFLPARDFDASGVGRFIRRPTNEFMTDLFDAAGMILRKLPASERPCNIFLISDGKANYSTADVRRIVQGFSRERRDNFSIFAFLAGDKVNADLLELLAYRSRGALGRMGAGQSLEASLLSFIRRFDQPVLAGCVASYTNLETDSVFPRVLPNLYRGEPVTFTGRSHEPGSFVIRVLGYGASGAREFFFRPAGQKPLPGASIYRQWAAGRGYDMVQGIIDASAQGDYQARLTELKKLIAGSGLEGLATMAGLLESAGAPGR